VTAQLVPAFADWAIVNLVDEEGGLFLAASHHRDPQLDARTRRLVGLRYLASDAAHGLPAVVRTKKPLLYETVPAGGIGAVTDPYRNLIASLEFLSAAIVPIMLGGTVRGTVVAISDRTSGRRYDQRDVPFFGEVARRLAPAAGCCAVRARA